MAGGGSQTSTVHQSNLPQYAKPYYEEMMNRTLGESERPYQPYEGQRLAGISPSTAAGLNMSQQYAQSGTGLGLSQAALADAVSQAGQMGYDPTAAFDDLSYTPGQFDNTYDPATFGHNYSGSGNINDVVAGWSGIQSGGQTHGDGVNQVTSQNFDQAAMQQYMSPYMQAVVDKAKQDALLQAQQEAVYRNSQAATTGAFGGSRHAVASQMANNALLDRMTGIDVEGHQAAFENAQQQFERDRQAGMTAQQTNQQTALQMLLGNQQSMLGTQQLRDDAARAEAQFGLQTQQMQDAAAQQKTAYDLQAQQMRDEASRAFQTFQQQDQQMRDDALRAAEQYRQSGLGLQAETAKGLADLAGMQDQMMLSRIKAQLGVGQTVEDYQQQQLDMAYNDFVNQRDSERQNLQFLSSILRGVPISANRDITTTEPTNPLAGLLGSATGLQALYQLGQQQG